MRDRFVETSLVPLDGAEAALRYRIRQIRPAYLLRLNNAIEHEDKLSEPEKFSLALRADERRNTSIRPARPTVNKISFIELESTAKTGQIQIEVKRLLLAI